MLLCNNNNNNNDNNNETVSQKSNILLILTEKQGDIKSKADGVDTENLFGLCKMYNALIVARFPPALSPA